MDRTITTLIVKVTSACNLACPYCFMFEHVDKSFQDRSDLMPEQIRIALARRVHDYLDREPAARLLIVFHGGEPLLLGHARFRHLCEALRSGQHWERLDLALQTNATLVDEEYLELFREYGITVGVSLDGPPEVNDKSRPAKSRASSYSATVGGLRRLQAGLPPDLFRGLLAVVQLDADPLSVFDHFLSLGVTRMDFLLPLRNHRYPWGYKELTQANSTPHADWLLEIVRQWRRLDDPNVRIRLFDSVLELLLGSNANRADIHHSALDVITVESDGAIEPVDDLRVAGPSVNRTPFNVLQNDLVEILKSEEFHALREAETYLPKACLSCDYVRVCGGGGLAYRRNELNYDSPSIYCEEIKKLIGQMAAEFQLSAL